MKRRVRILHPGYLVGTKGHSVLKKKTYLRKPLIEVDEFSYSKMPTSRRHEIDSLGSFHNAAAFSNAVMDDSYDLQAQSRGRDHRLMTQMNNALEQLSSIMATPPSSSYKASKPPNPYPSYSWRAIRDVDGYTKPPTNIMSWQYRLESRLEPDDLIHKPSSYGTMRDQVRDVQDKLDRHRQLLDRHANRAPVDSGLGDSHAAGGGLSAGRTTEEGGADGTGKVSPLRKKLRKVICKSRHDPTYYDD